MAIGFTSSSAQATLFFSDDFAYADGNLAGNDGGTGWLTIEGAVSAWSGGEGSNGNQVANPLPGMSGKSIQISSVSTETSRPLSTTYISGGATTYYISFAFNAAPLQGFDAGANAGVSVFLAANRSNNLLGGMPGSSGALGFDWTGWLPQASGFVSLSMKPSPLIWCAPARRRRTTRMIARGCGRYRRRGFSL